MKANKTDQADRQRQPETKWIKVYSPDTGWYYIGGSDENKIMAQGAAMSAQIRSRHPAAGQIKPVQ